MGRFFGVLVGFRLYFGLPSEATQLSMRDITLFSWYRMSWALWEILSLSFCILVSHGFFIRAVFCESNALPSLNGESVTPHKLSAFCLERHQLPARLTKACHGYLLVGTCLSR